MSIKKTTILTLLIAIVFMSGCTSPQDADRALSAQGFSDITYTGYDFMACSEDDIYHTGFRAKNPQGRYVSGTVCSGIFKNATVRF